jgi:hypothetical protein
VKNARLLRWALKLQEYHFSIFARPGKDNGNADVLSRDPSYYAESEAEVQGQQQRVVSTVFVNFLRDLQEQHRVRAVTTRSQKRKATSLTETEVQSVCTTLESNTREENSGSEAREESCDQKHDGDLANHDHLHEILADTQVHDDLSALRSVSRASIVRIDLH